MNRHDQAGTSLLEVLVATTIIGFVVMAIVGGYMTTVSISSHAGERAEAESALSALSSDIAALPYLPCATRAQRASQVSSLPQPDGYRASVVSVTYLDAAVNRFVTTCTKDRGAQLLTIEVVPTAANGSPRRMSAVVREPTARPS